MFFPVPSGMKPLGCGLNPNQVSASPTQGLTMFFPVPSGVKPLDVDELPVSGLQKPRCHPVLVALWMPSLQLTCEFLKGSNSMGRDVPTTKQLLGPETGVNPKVFAAGSMDCPEGVNKTRSRAVPLSDKLSDMTKKKIKQTTAQKL